MRDRMLGLETEYALTVIDRKGRGINREKIVQRLFKRARNKLPHLVAMNHQGMFLPNGSLLYLDCGLHVEYATPECLDPLDVVRYQAAGDHLLADLVRDVATKEWGVSEAVFSRCNVDYAYNSRTTWGCHESYLHRGEPEKFPVQIIPHLVSRIVYTGAGGWNSVSPDLEFLLSPRVVHLVTDVSYGSTQDRGLFHTKDEPLSGKGYHRLHLLCGESLCSETASWLKLGTTALIVALIEAGLKPGEGVMPRSPLEAMKVFAGDPECKAVVKGSNGASFTAMEMQRHYLAQVQACVHDPFMPPWAEAVCQKWRETLDRLDKDGPESMQGTLDWAMKLALFQNHARRCGFEWDQIARWNYVLRRLREALDARGYDALDAPIRAEVVLGTTTPVPEEIANLMPFMKQNGLHWDSLKRFLLMREELFEADFRFSQIGKTSIFGSLDRRGLLDHRLPGVGKVEEALEQPPKGGRAHLRGQVISRLVGESPVCWCDWSRIFDPNSGNMLDLSDPFEKEERWIPSPTRQKRRLATIASRVGDDILF
jgi:Pup-ligase protein